MFHMSNIWQRDGLPGDGGHRADQSHHARHGPEQQMRGGPRQKPFRDRAEQTPSTARSSRSSLKRSLEAAALATVPTRSAFCEWLSRADSSIGERIGKLLGRDRCCSVVSCNHRIFTYGRLVFMHSLLRNFLLWILIVSLPIRGMAGAVVLPCAMEHTPVSTATAQSMDSCDEAEMSMSAPRLHASGDTAAEPAHHDLPCDKELGQKHASCRTCPACHVGTAAPPPFSLASPAAGHVANHRILPAQSFTGWIPSRIERPPRV